MRTWFGPGVGGLLAVVPGSLIAIAALLFGSVPVARAATITVTTATDEATPNNGHVSLREAITAINAGNDLGDPDITAQHPGAFGTNDTINFGLFVNLRAPCPKTINVGADPSASGLALPAITQSVTIDGYSQAGSSPNTQAVGDDAKLCIVLDGSSVSGSGNDPIGLKVDAPNVTVKGLALHAFDAEGILVEAAGRNATIQGSFIGPDATGNTARPALGGIVVVGAPSVTIGGTTPAARNLISGNSLDDGGILATAPTATGLKIQGNYIGTNAAGTSALPNSVGVFIVDVPSPTIGGTVPGAGNVISGNSGSGIRIEDPLTSGPIIQGNLIGTNAAGTAALANATGIDVKVGTNLTIGGATEGTANVIALNTGKGVLVEGSSSAVDVRGNAIFSNGGLGIDLGNDGVTANDPGDADTGPNNLQNFPILTQAAVGNGSTVISGTLNSAVNASFTLDFYANPGCDEPSLHGEGQTYLGSGVTSTNGGGNAGFTISGLATASVGNAITATATDTSGNTSEFSACQTAVAAGVTVLPTSVSVTEGGAPATFTVALTSIPTTTVTITLSFDAAQLTVSPPTLTFHPDATATAQQTVTVTAVDNVSWTGRASARSHWRRPRRTASTTAS